VSASLDGFGEQYVAALGSFLKIGDEAALHRALALGRAAMARPVALAGLPSA